MMHDRLGAVLLLVSLLHPLDVGGRLRAQGPDAEATRNEVGGVPPKPDEDPARRLEQYKQAAGTYTIRRESEPPVTLSLKPEPCLRWNSPLRTAYDGVFFVWIAGGRPEAAATFYRNLRDGAPFEQHEF